MANDKRESRREFLLNLGVVATGVATSAALSGCGGGDDNCTCGENVGSQGGASGSGGTTTGNTGSAVGGTGSGGSTSGTTTGIGTGGVGNGGVGTGGTGTSGIGGTASTPTSSMQPAGGSGTGGTQAANSSTDCPPATQCATPAVLPTDWSREVDVVVLGTGFAGLSTAIAAADAGAKVLILEKMSETEEGGNSKVSGNMWWTPTSASDGVTYIKALCSGLTDDTCIQTLAQAMAELNTYLGTLGVSPSALGVFQPEYPELSGSSTVRTWSNGASGTLWQALRNAVTSRKIDVLYQTPAVDLIQDPSTREVKGVIATSGARTSTSSASAGSSWPVEASNSTRTCRPSTCRGGPCSAMVRPVTRAMESEWD